ncbi:MAG TPA: hypothetical protein VF421_02160 [Niabella sp.]
MDTISIMERLYKEGIKYDKVKVDDWSTDQKQLFVSLDTLKENGFIEYAKRTDGFHWVKLSLIGLSYMQQMDINASIKDTNTIQKWSLLSTGFLILIGAFFQMMTWSIAKDEYRLHIRQDTTKKEALKIENIGASSLLDSVHTIRVSLDSISSKVSRLK